MSEHPEPPTATVLAAADQLAVEALAATVLRDPDRIRTAVAELNNTRMLLWAMTAWIDMSAVAAADRAGISLSDITDSHLFIPVACTEDGTPVPMDDQEPEHQWAMRTYTARVAGDRDTFEALIRTAPTEPNRHIAALLTMCADMMVGTSNACFETAEVTR